MAKPKQAAPTGRPSKYTPELASIICDGLAEGKSLRAICTQEGMPSKTTVFRWLESNEIFRDQYIRAREIQADTMFDLMIEIADEDAHDAAAVSRNKLRIETRKWVMGKLRPKVYGDKIEASDPDDQPVTRIKIEVVNGQGSNPDHDSAATGDLSE